MTSFRSKALLAFVSLFFVSAQSWAAMTLVSITGASEIDLTDTTKPIVYGGFAGTCKSTEMDGTKTCDSCTGATVAGTGLWPCNKKNSYAALKLTIRVSYTLTGVTTGGASLKIGDTEVSGVTYTLEGGSILNAQVTWGQLCGTISSGTDCTASFDKTLTLSIKNSTASESLDIRGVARYIEVANSVGTEWVYTDCNTTEVTTNFGFCHFEAFPGDAKIFPDNTVVSTSSYPASPVSGVPYKNVVFFYKAQASGDSDDTTVASITNDSDSFIVGVNSTTSPPEMSDTIDGLINDQRYCMVMANQDVAGNIYYFTPVASNSSSPVASSELCTTPSQVVGMLDDKHCFIATAAFGSMMAPEVQSFREFRNQYLLTNPLGRAFVKMYYKYSPFYANLIAESEVSRGLVRIALWPLLLFARLSVVLGLLPALFIAVVSVLSLFELYRRLVLGRKFRGEL